jgi:hypothetical protein
MRVHALLAMTAILAGAARTDAEQVDFERHVASLLGKFGCSSGACHGSFQGRGGLRLSLFGHDPAQDFEALSRAVDGRRVNVHAPDQSLILLKATGQIQHGGGRRFAKDSHAYDVIRAWIAQGCRYQAGSGAVRQLRVVPAECILEGPGRSAILQIDADFADGTSMDVTRFCDFRAKDDMVAEVSSAGEVRGTGAGDTSIIVSYRGNFAVGRVLVPFPVEMGFAYPRIHANNYIDREVMAKLRRLNIVPAPLATDTEFLRRVWLDTVGTIPAPDEVRAFLADTNAHKRGKKIDELLTHPMHAALWAGKFCDITACNEDVLDGPAELRGKQAAMWFDWLRKRVADNRPYDEIARGVLLATSREGQGITHWLQKEGDLHQAAQTGFRTSYAARHTLDLFWRRLMGEDFFPLEQMAELTATAFLGIRIECAQCHKHPFDQWTQADYRAYANIFGQVQFGSSPEVRSAVMDLLEKRRRLPRGQAGPPPPRAREVYLRHDLLRQLAHPETNEPLPAKALGGPVLQGDGDRRAQLFRWMVRPDNPWFARSFVNRVWAHYFGKGIVEPVDGFSAANPPSNQRLLDLLARDFTDHGYDIRRLERTILQSRTYQLSSVANSSNAADRSNYSRALARALPAEVVVDMLNAALGTVESAGSDAPAGSRAIEVASNRVRAEHLARIFRVFGRPARTATCDCERPRDPALPQTLFLMTDPVLLKKMSDGRLKRLLSENRPDAGILEELFLATVSRMPDGQELQTCLNHVRACSSRDAGYLDLLWALINTREFILNH